MIWITVVAVFFALGIYKWLDATTQDMPRVDPR